jgi:hypothetical protein
MPRTEEEKLTQSPLKVKFGEIQYTIKLLPVLKSRDWRAKVEQELGPMVAGIQPMAVAGRFVIAGLSTAIARFPEKMCDLLFAYAEDLPKDKILAEATEEQIDLAFSQLWEIAFANFLPQLSIAKEMLNPRAPSPSANSLN